MKKKDYSSWLVLLKLSKELKNIGFKIKSCFYYSFEDSALFVYSKPENYNKKCNEEIFVTIPTWEQVFEWFRRKGLFHSICFTEDLIEEVKGFEIEIRDNNADIIHILHQDTYERAMEAVVKKLIEIYGDNINI